MIVPTRWTNKPRVFLRYPNNRKVFDLAEHRYTRCAELADLVVGGTEIVVEGYLDGTDHTNVTLARHLVDLLRDGERGKALALSRAIVARLGRQGLNAHITDAQKGEA